MSKYIVVLLVAFMLSGCNIWKSWNDTGLSDYDRVVDSSVLEVGYINYGVSFLKDPSSWEFSGIFYEIMEEIWNRLNIDIEYKYELGWWDMIEALNSNKIDLVVTWIWPTSSRSKWIDYISPIYFSNLEAYVRIDDTRFDNDLDIINNEDIIIWVIDGEMTSIIAESDFPKAQTLPLIQQSDINQLLLDLTSEKSDITFLEPAIALEFLSKNPWTIRRVEGVKTLRSFWNNMLIDKWEFELQSMINNVIFEMQSEWVIDKILDKYERYSGSFFRIK